MTDPRSASVAARPDAVEPLFAYRARMNDFRIDPTSSALLIVDCGPGFRNDAARAQWNDYAERRAQDFETKGLAALTGRSREIDPAAHRSADGLANAARGMLKQRDPRIIDSLPAISVPTLVIVGANDKPFLDASEYMAKKISGARKVVIPEAGHAANIDAPAPFNLALTDFLDRLD